MLGCAINACAEEAAEPERALVRAAVQLAGVRAAQLDAAGCLTVLEPTRGIAWADAAVGNSWIGMVAHCTFLERHDAKVAIPFAEIQTLMEPWRQRFAQMKPSFSEEELFFQFAYWHLLHNFGHRDAGDRMFMAELQKWIDQLASHPDDSEANKALLAFAWLTNGSWKLHAYTRDFHALFRDRLGEGHPVTLVTLRSLAYGERYLGRPQKALALIEEAFALTERYQPANASLRLSMRSERAACLANMGRLAESFAQALLVRDAVLQRANPPALALVRSHYALAEMAEDMGDHRAAIAFADQSIDYARRSGNELALVEARIPGAVRETARLALGEPGAAQALKSAVELAADGEMHIGPYAFTLVRHAAAADDSALLGWSSDFMRVHIRRFRTPFHSDRAVLDLMDAWQLGGSALRVLQVREPLERAVAGSLTGRSPGTQALMQFNLARHLEPADPDTAVWLYKRAANDLQRLRSGLPTGDDELHRAWLSAHEADLRYFIALLIDQGRLVEAEQAVLVLRDEEITEYTRRSQGRRDAPPRALSFTPIESARDARMEQIAVRVSAAAAEADMRADAWRTQALKNTYRDERADAALALFQAEIHEVLEQAPALRGAAPRQAQLTGPALPPGTARLMYFVRPDAFDIVVQDGRRYRRVAVPIGRAELNRRIQALRAVVGSPTRDPRPAAEALHAVLIAPITQWLRDARSQTLRIAPDSSLRYVPFAALHDGRQYLAQRFALSIDMAGSLGREPLLADASRPNKGIAVFGRSVGNDEFSALPGVQRELSAVTRNDGSEALNAAFTPSSLRAALARHPAVVHIASHFVIDPAGEDKSFLLLGDGSRLALGDVRQLPWGGVRLALLSACDSAVAVDVGQGRELVGFASALLGAGVGNVVASLWRVADGATADWMSLFYAHQHAPNGGGLSPATLALTQRRWLQRYAGSALAHPHYWAAFQWMAAR